MKVKNIRRRTKIHLRIRKQIKGTQERPRLAVFRSNKQIYAQIIDDMSGHTLVSSSTREKTLSQLTGNKTAHAKEVGKALGEKAKAAGIQTVVFDRGGFLYHGRVKALAEGARETGLIF